MTPTANQTGISFALKDLPFAQQLHESARHVLPEIAGLIRKHGLENDIAIRLLHTHFPLDDDDALIHRWRGDTIETQVGRAPAGAIACTFTPSQTDAGRLDAIEYLAPGAMTAAARARVARVLECRAFIEEAGAVLARDGMNTLYGLGARFYAEELDAGDDLILVERNNFAERRSETRAMDRHVLDGEVWTETSWRVVGGGLVAESACITSGAMPCEAPPPPPPA